MNKLALTLAALLLLTACGGNPTPTVQPTTQQPTATVTPNGTDAPVTDEPSPSPTAEPTPTAAPDNLAPPPTEDDVYLQAVMAMSDDERLALDRELEVNATDDPHAGAKQGWLNRLESNRHRFSDDEGGALPNLYETLSERFVLLYVGQTYRYDLDNDGAEDTFHVATHTDFGASQEIYITINGTCEKILGIKAPRLCSDVYLLVDIDKSDGYKELVFETQDDTRSGPYSSAVSHVFCYRNGAMQYMNSGCNDKRSTDDDAPGFRDGEVKPDWIKCALTGLHIDGSGALRVEKPLNDNIERLNYYVDYQLTKSHMLAGQPDQQLLDIAYDADYWYTFEIPFTAYYERDTGSKTTTINATTKCHLTRTDNLDWIEVTLKSGKKFWLYIDDVNGLYGGNPGIQDFIVLFGVNLSYAGLC